MQITARQIFDTPLSDIWNLKKGKYTLTFEDGEESQATRRSLIFNRYCWELIKPYPTTPITKICDVNSHIKEGDAFDINTTTKTMEGIFGHVCEFNRIYYYKDKDPLLLLVFQVTTLIFNEIVHNAGADVSTVDALDFLDIMQREEIKTLHENLQPHPDSIEKTYRGIKEFISKAGKDDNNFIGTYRGKSSNDNQSNQMIGPRGFVTAVDRTVYRRPILNGFIRGMGTLFEIMTESLTAAKSLSSQENSIRTSEYSSRRVQLISMVIRSVTTEDCGSDDLMDVVVTRKYLSNMLGKWYVEKEGDKLKYIKGDETHLIDKVIKVRNVFGCKHIDRKKICTRCLGQISENFLENSNLGYTFAAFLMEMVTQSLLSTKHLTHSVRSSRVKLEGLANKYLGVGTSGDEIILRPDVDFTNLALQLPSSKLAKLTDVLNIETNEVAVNKIGELDVIGIRDLTKRSTAPVETLTVSYMDRFANISRDLLKHIRRSDYTVDVRGNYIVPLKGFNTKKPFLNVPLKEASLVAFANRVTKYIEFTDKRNSNNLKEHFFDLLDTVYEQLPVPMTAIETIVYATTSFNAAEGDFRLGRGSPNMRQTNRTDLFINRSNSAHMVFQGQMANIIKNPEILFGQQDKRESHPLDVLFTPQEVVDKFMKENPR